MTTKNITSKFDSFMSGETATSTNDEGSASSRAALSDPATNQNVWLQVSPFPRPGFGYSSQGRNKFRHLSNFTTQFKQ